MTSNQFLLAPNDAQLMDLARIALDAAEQRGTDQCEVVVSEDRGLNVQARLRDVETIEYQHDRALSVHVYFEHCKGAVSIGDFSPDAIRMAVDKACAIARQTAADPYSGLADPQRLATAVMDLDLDHAWHIDADDARDLALQCEAYALDHDSRIVNSEGAGVSTGRGVRVYGNSHGFLQSVRRSSHSLSCTVLAEHEGAMERDYHYTVARDPADLESAQFVGTTAARRTLHRLGARKLSTRQAPVLFAADQARGLLGHAVGALAGGAQYRKASFLLDAAGKQIFPDFLSLRERPHLEKAFGSRSFDREGVATSDRDLVRDGTVQGYVLSSYSARRLELETTGNAGGIHNLEIDVGTRAKKGRDELLAQMGEGLFVTELMGQGVNPVTGDYSRGAAGYWVEGGQIRYPVHEITIAGNLKEIYLNIADVGSDTDTRGVIRSGSILVSAMTIAGD